MFEVGDKIYYPMHGAGVIEAIEEKEILGEKQLYYIIKMSFRNIQLMIPMEKTSSSRIRPLVDSQTLEDVLAGFHQGETDSTINKTQRYRNNILKLKSGDIYEGAQVIRDLCRLNKKKSLGTDDKAMLNQAQQFLISELVYVKGIKEEQATEMLNRVIG